MHSLVFGIQRYKITIFGHCPEFWQRRINNILKGILKSVAYKFSISSSDDLFSALNLPTLDSLFKQTAVLSHFWDSPFMVPSNPSRLLRHVSHFEVPRTHARYGECMQSHLVPYIFNLLPDDIFEIRSKSLLKEALSCLL